MLRFGWLALAMLGLPALAQAPMPPGYMLDEYVEAHRPVILKRKLTAEEQAEARRLIAEINTAVNKEGRLSYSVMDQLAPLAATGDRDAMKAMVAGYGRANGDELKPSDNPGLGGWEISFKLRGLWGLRLWNEGGRSKETSQALGHCLAMEKYEWRRCGYKAVSDNESLSDAFTKHSKGKGGVPQKVAFTEYPLVDTTEADSKRFAKFLKDMRSGTSYVAADYMWSEVYAQRQGPEAVAARRAATEAWTTSQINKQANARRYAEEDRQAKVAEWDKLVAAAKDAKSRGTTLSDNEQDRWVKLSYELGGTYLLPYASQTVLFEKSAIESLCAANRGKVCQRQIELFEARAEDRRRELAAMDAPVRPPALPGDVTVRTYDQNGNYTGSTNLRPWQADIVGAN